MFRRLAMSVFFGFPLVFVLAQDISVSGVMNHYLAVDSVLSDRVRLSGTDGIQNFKPGDKILIIQMTGAELFGPADFSDFMTRPSRTIKTFKNTGKFEVLQLDEVVVAGGRTYLVFTDELANDYDDGEKIQAVRFIEGETVNVTGTLTAKDWDGSTGGIVAVIGTDSVILNANIDANYKGFRGGAVPSENYTGGCRSDISPLILDTLYFTSLQLNRSGNKGEGIISTSWPYTKGAGFSVNGGGAGNGLFSGGAGGTNYLAGGDGGHQSSACPSLLTAAWGGYGCYLLYTSASRQILMGGGGGSGVRSESATASAGGDGGGIVIIVTGTLVSNGYSVTADGQSPASSTGSGGGGGGGGTILIDATAYTGSLSVSAAGGNGGSTNDNCTGSGGGGGGGVLWHSGSSITAASINLSGGEQGYVTTGCVGNSGNGGSAGDDLANLIMPLNGFLFNTIRNNDTICEGQVPVLLKASSPKGGNGFYDFVWEQSTDSLNWTAAQGTAILTALQPVALDISTWYRRIVTSDTIADTSRVIKVFVYPSIENNTIAGTDTICYGLEASQLNGTLPAGGNNTFTYHWQADTGQDTWSDATAPYSSNMPFEPGSLTATTYYRRVVKSTAYCSDTSNSVTVTVLPSLTDNIFVSPDTVICRDQEAGLLNALQPSGGDGDYDYLWQKSTESGIWEDISLSDIIRYNPGILTQTTEYRRIVFSGNDNACADTSASRTVNVLPLISNNILDSDSGRYCAGDVPLAVSGTIPSGGAGSYTYSWESDDGTGWKTMNGIEGRDYLPDVAFESGLSVRRIVYSGSYNACMDTSDAFEITVIPHIVNQTGLEDQTICENTVPLTFNAAPASGGLNSFTYEWFRQDEGSSDWFTAEGDPSQVTYSAGALQNTRYYVRKAFSDICTSISDTVIVLVYPSIENNNTGNAEQYTCYSTSRLMTGSAPSGGKQGDYEYLWLESGDGSSWFAAAGENTGLSYLTSSLTEEKYYRRIVYSGTTARECVDTSSTVKVLINPLPSGDIISSRDTICAGETSYVKFNVSGVNGPFTVIAGDGSVTATGYSVMPGIDSVAVSLTQSLNLHIISIVDDSSCYADISANSGLAEVIVYDIPVADAGADQEVCGDVTTLAAVKSINGSEGAWSGPATFADASLPGSSVTTGIYGSSTFIWTETNWRCSDDDEVIVVFYEEPETAEAGSDQVTDFAFVTTLEATPASAGTGKWTVSSGNAVFDNSTEAYTGVSELDYENVFIWTVTNGVCEPVSDSVQVNVTPLKVNKAFTPNGDSRNDVFETGVSNAELVRIKVFNASGVLVYSSDNYGTDNLWDGFSLNGIELPEGTYYYILDVKMPGKQEELQYRSFVEILR